ncbi:hypothetical protein ACHAQA_008054 [Verticillium albo-atrum]
MARFLRLLPLFAALALGQDVPKGPPSTSREVFPSGLSFFNEGNIDVLPRASSTVSPWEWGVVPEACHAVAADKRVADCDPRDLEVFDVRYDDCAVPWTICRCKNAEAALETVVDRLGRVPIGARETVRYVHVHKRISGVAGLSFFWDGDIALFGEATSMGVYLHEVAHNMDFWIAGGGRFMYSQQETWKDAVLGETCVADRYAKSSFTEAFAQVGVSVAYDVNVGPISSVGDVSCMAGTFDKVRLMLGAAFQRVEGQRCASRISEDDVPLVCVGPEAACAANMWEVTTAHRKPMEGVRTMAQAELGMGERKRLADAVKRGIKEHKHTPIA